jgi:hypothetical protein
VQSVDGVQYFAPIVVAVGESAATFFGDRRLASQGDDVCAPIAGCGVVPTRAVEDAFVVHGDVAT